MPNFSIFWSLDLIACNSYFCQGSSIFKDPENRKIWHFPLEKFLVHGANANSKGLPVGGALRAPIKNVYRNITAAISEKRVFTFHSLIGSTDGLEKHVGAVSETRSPARSPRNEYMLIRVI